VIEKGEKQGLVVENEEMDAEEHEVKDREVEDPLQHSALLRKLGKIQGYEKSRVHSGIGALYEQDEERTEPVEESEYNVGGVHSSSFGSSSSSSSASHTSEETISLAGLMSSLHETTGFGELKKQMEELNGKSGDAKKKGSGRGSKQVSGPMAVPLADVQRERIDREVAYEKTSKDITRWQPQVSANRRAEQLNFSTQQGPEQRLSNAELTAKFVESTPLECGIADILRECGFDDEQTIKEFEQSQLEQLDDRDQKARSTELSRMRRLMFYREQKTKRWKKIKSRKFHKQRQKDKAASQLSVEELETIDPEVCVCVCVCVCVYCECGVWMCVGG
jgi:U3 small nucleolar RNA-associated protein 14